MTTNQLHMARTTSADGTPIAWFSSGEGPPLLLIHGSAGDHSRWNTLRTHLESLLAEGKDEEVVITLFRDAVGSSDEELEIVRSQPSWPGRVAAAHTLPRELRVHDQYRFDPEEAARITVPTLLLVGANAPDRFQPKPVLEALPDGHLAELEGQEHEADIVAPQLVADQLVRFLRDNP